MNKQELIMLQALPLEVKVAKSKLRIEEFIRYMGGPKNVYISFSGGKDSTVLLHLVRELYPETVAVFSNTGLEYPEIVTFVKSIENVEIITPKKTFKQVIEEDGYPMISKKTSRMLHDLQNPTSKNEASRNLYLSDYVYDRQGNLTRNRAFRLAKKWEYLVNAPFKISHKCCIHLKKKPLSNYSASTGKKPIIGTLASEGSLRESMYLDYGCNVLTEGNEKSTPLGFWTTNDILKYLKDNNIRYSTIYGDIEQDANGNYYTTKEDRTGCIYCGFCKDLNQLSARYLRLEKNHPKLYDYCMNKLGFKEVCEFMNIKYTDKGE